MFSSIFKDKKDDRIGLLVSAAIFGFVGVVQLLRAVTGVPVEFAGYIVPIWPSIVVGFAALLMSYWMAMIMRRH